MAGKRRTYQQFLESTIDRFWSYVSKQGPDDCWIWEGPNVTPPGGVTYGKFWFHDDKTINVRPHRFAWMLMNGRIPEGKVIMHNCDVALCVNPAHLQCGTQKQNIRDMKKRGRFADGSKHGNSKLTEEQARIAKFSNEKPSVLGRRFGVHPTAITAIRNGRNWAHLTPVEKDQ